MTGIFRRATVAALAAAILTPPAFAAEPVRIGLTFLAAGLDPAQGSTGWALVSHGLGEQLFTVSRGGEVVPNLATGATRESETEWTVTLAEGRSFADGTPVEAEAVALALNRTGEANPSARASAGRLTFEAMDALTLRVTTERATPILPSILAEWAFPVYRLEGENFVFTGPFMVESFEPGARIEMAPNPHYAEADSRPEVDLIKVADGQALALAFQAGELDMAFHLPAESLPGLEGEADLTVKSFPVGYQNMMWMNTSHPPLDDPRVREAIDLALSREDSRHQGSS